MNKKQFFYLSLFGSLLIFSTLPLFNYHIDQWRVLKSDYKKMHRDIEPNRSYLKVKYLIENKNKYDTLLMGSSRMGDIDASKISNSAYNMAYSFGVIGLHLKNLKTLLENKVGIKNIILGVNEYAIWKNPESYYNDYLRQPYETSLIDNLKVKLFYLFKKPQKRDFDIFLNGVQLHDHPLIINPNTIHKRRQKEKQILKFELQKHKNYILNSSPILLGYKNNNYRIDAAVQEMKEFVSICEKHNINLKVFIFPSYKNTLLSYNQDKISEFKLKLAEVVNYYDFYRLDDISKNEISWRDTLHFMPSIGDHIIESIKKPELLVTKANIIQHLKDIDNEIVQFKVLTKDKLKISISKTIIDNKKKIFDINESQYEYYSKNGLKISQNKLTTSNPDPIIILNKLTTKAKSVVLKFSIESSIQTQFELFYKENKQDKYNKNNSYKLPINLGTNKVQLSIPSEYINNNLRVDFVNAIGTFNDIEFKIFE